MNQSLLVTYATRTGSTQGVAEMVARVLAEHGQSVDVRRMADVDDLSPYRAVVAGSAINGGQWLPEAMRFIRLHQAALRQRPLAAFTVCITLSMKGGDQYRAAVAGWTAPMRALVRPVSEGLFAGALDLGKLPLSPRSLLMRVPVLLGVWRAGDHRDWAAIQTWARQIGPLLAN